MIKVLLDYALTKGIKTFPCDQRVELLEVLLDYALTKGILITHDPQPASRADMASEGLPRLHAPIQPTCS